MNLLAALLILAPAVQGRGTLVVLPPDTPPEAEIQWVGEVVADLLPRALLEAGVPAVERADRLRAQEALAVPSVPLTRATSIRIAEALGASRLVVGTCDTKGSGLTLSLRILDVERGTLSAPLVGTGPLESVADLVRGLAWDIALAGPVRPTRSREDFMARRLTVPFEALKAYAQGLSAPLAAPRVQLLRRALSLAPSFDHARVALGRSQVESREFAAAYETLSRVEPASPLGRPARFVQGVALLALGRYRDASQLYAGLAADDPTPAMLNNHALALLRLGGSSGIKASQVLRKAVEMAPEVRELPFNLGWALFSEGDAEAAVFWTKGVLREDPRDTHARVILTWALRASGHGAEADQEWKGLTALAPSYEALATPDLSRRFERVLPSERLIVLDPGVRTDAELAASHLGAADRLEGGGDLDGALRELTQAALLDPYGARVHLALGRLHRARKEGEKAVAEFRMSLWCRDDTAVRLELARLLKELGRAPEARTEAERILKAEPGNDAARALLQS